MFGPPAGSYHGIVDASARGGGRFRLISTRARGVPAQTAGLGTVRVRRGRAFLLAPPPSLPADKERRRGPRKDGVLD